MACCILPPIIQWEQREPLGSCVASCHLYCRKLLSSLERWRRRAGARGWSTGACVDSVGRDTALAHGVCAVCDCERKASADAVRETLPDYSPCEHPAGWRAALLKDRLWISCVCAFDQRDFSVTQHLRCHCRCCCHWRRCCSCSPPRRLRFFSHWTGCSLCWCLRWCVQPCCQAGIKEVLMCVFHCTPIPFHYCTSSFLCRGAV